MDYQEFCWTLTLCRLEIDKLAERCLCTLEKSKLEIGESAWFEPKKGKSYPCKIIQGKAFLELYQKLKQIAIKLINDLRLPIKATFNIPYFVFFYYFWKFW